jgi:hypothetical protein
MARPLSTLLFVFLPAGLALLLASPVLMPSPQKDATTLILRDGRKLAFETRGRLDRKNVIFWNHGVISSR